MQNEKAGKPEIVYYGIVGCTLSLISCIIGSGIVAMPYSVRLTQSLPIFMGMNLVTAVLLLMTSKMLLEVSSNVKELFSADKKSMQQNLSNDTEGVNTNAAEDDDEYQQKADQEDGAPQVQLSDLSYLFMGRTGIFMVSGFMSMGLFGICVLFYLFFAQTLLSIFPIEKGSTTYFWSKAGIIITLVLAQFPVALKRQISEMSIQRFFMPIGVVSVLLVLIYTYLSKSIDGEAVE